jgi:predicted nuclease of predicted toxin-antitoxin system
VKLLLDACVWGGARAALTAAGHDVVWAGEWAEDPGDEAILARALQERRVLVTLDKDFGELAIVRGEHHSGIVRIVDFAARDLAGACLQVLALHGADLIAGALVTVEPGRIRVRPPDHASS